MKKDPSPKMAPPSVGSSYARTFTEKEPTCPGGGRMTWRVAVDEPRTKPYVALYAFISIEESAADEEGTLLEKDSLLLDLDAARWLHKTLGEAIEIGEDAEKRAALLKRDPSKTAVND